MKKLITGAKALDYRGRETCQYIEREGDSNEKESVSNPYGSGDGGSDADERTGSRKPLNGQ